MTPFITFTAKMIYIVAGLFTIGGVVLIIQSVVGIHTSGYVEDFKSTCLSNIVTGTVAIIISIVAIIYLGDFLDSPVDYI